MIGLVGIDIGLDRLVEAILGRHKRRQEAKSESNNYLAACIEESSKLGRDWVPDSAFLLDTEKAFVPMNLVSSIGRQGTLSTVLRNHRRLVIQGAPGAGKSTVVRFITLVMARADLDRKKYGQLPQQCLNCPPLFPIRVNLKRFAEVQDVSELILQSIPLVSAQYLKNRLDQGSNLFLFDGLDEVGSAELRYKALEGICDLTDRLSDAGAGNWFFVTTRPAGYRHRLLAGAGYDLYTLQELARSQQEALIRTYYSLWSKVHPTAEMGTDWQTRANELIRQLYDNPGLARLKGNPLLLSQIACLHFRGRSLPSRRHELYKQCVLHLVSRRERAELSQQELDARLALLGELALAMHQQQDKDALTHEEIEAVLANAATSHLGIPLAGSPASEIMDRLEKEWGLLIDRTDPHDDKARYGFLNFSLQEFLVAYLIHRYPNEHWPILKANLDNDWWQDVALLYTAMPARPSHPSPLDQLLRELIGPGMTPSTNDWIRAGRHLANEHNYPTPHAAHAEIVGNLRDLSYGEQMENVEALEALCQIEPDGRRFVLDRILARNGILHQEQILTMLRRMSDAVARQHLREAILAELAERPKISERIALAEALGQIGDTRLGQWIEIPAAPALKVKAAFRVGTYPVTNVEYAQFVADRGWPAPPHWQSDLYPMRQANHPITHVSFDDAEAYCEWLSSSSGLAHRLPTGAEWMAATQGDDPDRHFPWGGRMDQYYLNWRRNVGSTTPVGIYPEGKTDRGVFELLGNVWEWTSDRKGSRCILKGGAWDTMDLDERGLQATCLESPSIRRDNIGFRVIQIIGP